MKVVQDDQFLSQTRRLKTKLIRSFSRIKKWDYPILHIKCMRHMLLFRILLQKNGNIEKMCSLDTTYTDCRTRCRVHHRLQKGISLVFEKRWTHFSTTQLQAMNHGAIITYSSKQSSFTWKHKILSHAMKTRLKTSAGKVMLMLFFDISESTLVEWMSKVTTINAAQYTDTFMKLHTNIKNCQKGRLSAGIVLLHDNGKAHMAGLTQSMLMTLKFKVLTHPAYNSDLSPCDYEVFRPLKKFMKFLGHWRIFWVFFYGQRSQKSSKGMDVTSWDRILEKK